MNITNKTQPDLFDIVEVDIPEHTKKIQGQVVDKGFVGGINICVVKEFESGYKKYYPEKWCRPLGVYNGELGIKNIEIEKNEDITSLRGESSGLHGDEETRS